MKEIWRDIEGYEGLYQVSSLGRVKSFNYRHTCKESILKAGVTSNGYLFVCLYKDGKSKTHRIHRLVATAFIPNPDNLPEVNHKDEDKTNNACYNLEFCSRQYNMNYGTCKIRGAEKQSKQVLCIETGKIYPSTRQVEREFGFHSGNISHACRGNQKTAYGFHWRYI